MVGANRSCGTVQNVWNFEPPRDPLRHTVASIALQEPPYAGYLDKVCGGRLMVNAVQDAGTARAITTATTPRAARQGGRESVQQAARARAADCAPLSSHHQAALALRTRQRIPARPGKWCLGKKVG